jgi:hypothetical protein
MKQVITTCLNTLQSTLIGFTVTSMCIYGGDDLKFNVYFEECNAIQNIIRFPEIWRSVSDVQGTYLHIMFDIDILSNVYPKLPEIISKNKFPSDLRLSILENRPVANPKTVWKILGRLIKGLNLKEERTPLSHLGLIKQTTILNYLLDHVGGAARILT